MEVVPINKRLVKEKLRETGAVAILGMYGSGKSLVTSWLGEEMAQRGSLEIKLSLKDMPQIATSEMCRMVWDELAQRRMSKSRKMVGVAELRQELVRLAKNDKVSLIIEEAQQMLVYADEFWGMLLSLSYYERGRVEIILTAQPQIRSSNNSNIKRLLRGSVVAVRALTQEESIEVVKIMAKKLNYPLGRYQDSIARLAHGHYGTVKYISQLIAEHRFNGTRLTESRLTKWAESRGEMEYFVQLVWESLTPVEQVRMRSVLKPGGLKGLTRDKTVIEMIEMGYLRRRGGRIKLCVPWVESFLREYVEKIPPPPKATFEQQYFAQMGKYEKKLIQKLVEGQGKVVSYSELGEAIWQGENDKYSLWSLSQLVKRVRTKLSQVTDNYMIENVRGVGYKLICS